MAIVKVEGFDLVGTNADLNSKGWVTAEGTIGASVGRFGGAGYTLSGSTSNVLAFSQTFIRYTTVSFYFKAPSLSGTQTILAIDDLIAPSQLPGLNTEQLRVDTAADGSLLLYGDSSLRGTSVTGVIVANTWHHIELQADINASGQGVIVVDGVEVLDISGDYIDGSTAASVVFIGYSTDHILDDIVIQSSSSSQPTLLGEHKIQTLFPDADTAQADWTGVYTDIDDPVGSHDGDTTYISATTLNDKSEFTLSDLADTPSTINAVNLVTIARKTDAGTKGVTPYIVSDTTRDDGLEFGTSESYTVSQTIIENDPDTAAAWTASGINALKVGAEITT